MKDRLRTGECLRTSSGEIYVGLMDGSRLRLDNKTPAQLAPYEQGAAILAAQLDQLRSVLASARLSATPPEDLKADLGKPGEDAIVAAAVSGTDAEVVATLAEALS